jgi:hypothetical protein
MLKYRHVFSFLAAAYSLTSFSLSAGLIDWTDWTSNSTGPDTVLGTVNGIGITYTGDYDFVQLGTGTNYWTEDGTPAPYTSHPKIDNTPTPSELIGLNLSAAHKITFDTPVMNPVMAIVSLGRPGSSGGVDYDFDKAFDVLSEGVGYWTVRTVSTGIGTYSVSGNVLTGNEFHGVLQFTSSTPISEISWNSSPGEYWHGITIGVPVPEPSSLLAVLTALSLGGLFLRRRR